jgi:hypothetical protein
MKNIFTVFILSFLMFSIFAASLSGAVYASEINIDPYLTSVQKSKSTTNPTSNTNVSTTHFIIDLTKEERKYIESGHFEKIQDKIDKYVSYDKNAFAKLDEKKASTEYNTIVISITNKMIKFYNEQNKAPLKGLVTKPNENGDSDKYTIIRKVNSRGYEVSIDEKKIDNNIVAYTGCATYFTNFRQTYTWNKYVQSFILTSCAIAMLNNNTEWLSSGFSTILGAACTKAGGAAVACGVVGGIVFTALLYAKKTINNKYITCRNKTGVKINITTYYLLAGIPIPSVSCI